MKLIALHKKDGRIVAAVRAGPNYDGPVPVAGKGTKLVEIEIEGGHEKLDLAALCTRFRVNPRACKLVEHKPKRGSAKKS